MSVDNEKFKCAIYPIDIQDSDPTGGYMLK